MDAEGGIAVRSRAGARPWTVRHPLPEVDGVSTSYPGVGPAVRGDVDGDGHADLVVSDPEANALGARRKVRGTAGFAAVLSGADLTPLLTVTGAATGASSGLGTAVLDLGDLDADGFADLAVVASGSLHAFAGAAGRRSCSLAD